MAGVGRNAETAAERGLEEGEQRDEGELLDAVIRCRVRSWDGHAQVGLKHIGIFVSFVDAQV